MDNIDRSPSATPFGIFYLRANEGHPDITWEISSGRILLNGVLRSVPGISFTGDADVYLSAQGEDGLEEDFCLTTNPVSGIYSRKIISIRDGRVVFCDLSSLNVGMAEYQEKDRKSLSVGNNEPEFMSKRREQLMSFDGNMWVELCPFFEETYESFTKRLESVESSLVSELKRTKRLHEQYGKDTSYLDNLIKKLSEYEGSGGNGHGSLS